ncbi:mitochondrial inner membrane magnesium transporter LPE10 [Dipodascopsis tothii]|uniref:mitochondrial inner membrane magnesium transporter LPE10 n=1 Tax=Dipodascopsis tothii TaxID=44089 RepID=UPI0034CFE386
MRPRQPAGAGTAAAAAAAAADAVVGGSGGDRQQSRLEHLLLERSLMHKSTAENSIRCTIFDHNGQVSVVAGEFKKSELLSKHGLLPRDLRKLDTGAHTIVPSILVRNNSILVNLLHIRALIKADMVILFDMTGGGGDYSQTQSMFMYDLEGKLQQGSTAMGGLPYEQRALEAILISVVTALDAEMKVHTSVVASILSELEDDIDREKLRHLLIQSKALSTFLQKAQLVRDVLDDMLEQDEDLAGMYLTEKLAGRSRPPDQHSEVEMLFESYDKHCDEIVQATQSVVSNVRTTEEIVNIILDSNRNALMLLELKFSIMTLGLGGGAFVAALYGMNLRNTLEESVVGFAGVTAFATVLVGTVVLYGMRNLRKVQHITMMSDPPAEALDEGCETAAMWADGAYSRTKVSGGRDI